MSLVAVSTAMPDILRYVVVLGAFFGMGQVGIVLGTFYVVSRRAAPPPNLLFWHVAVVALSNVMLLILSMDAVIPRIGTPMTWRVPVALTGVVALNAAMRLVGVLERSRLGHRR